MVRIVHPAMIKGPFLTYGHGGSHIAIADPRLKVVKSAGEALPIGIFLFLLSRK